MIIEKNDTIYTILKHVSRSGMTRYIDCYVMRENHPINVSLQIGQKLGRKTQWDKGIKCDGAGMDMGFEVVYAYGQALFGDGYQLKQQWI